MFAIAPSDWRSPGFVLTRVRGGEEAALLEEAAEGRDAGAGPDHHHRLHRVRRQPERRPGDQRHGENATRAAENVLTTVNRTDYSSD